MSRFDSLAVFTRVADLGSFAAAARAMGISPAMVGNHVRALESWFGAPLLLRTTRQQTLTDTGRLVLDRARALLDGMSELDSIAEQPEQLSGTLRIGAPVGIGRYHVGPAARAFAGGHPGLKLELRLSDTVEDMVKAGLDLAVRNGPVPGNEASLVARVIARQELLLVASPAYLDRAGEPATLNALMRHRTVRYSRYGRPRSWAFEIDGATVQMDPPAAFMADHIETLLDAARDGFGIARLPGWLVASALRDGLLRGVLPEQPPLVIDTYLVRPATRVPPPRVMMAADHLATAIARSMKDGADAEPDPSVER